MSHADLRALVAGREHDLTPHIARLLATPRSRAAVPPGFDTVCRAVDAILVSTPTVVLPVARVGVLGFDATTVAIDGAEESVDALQILAPSRAVSLLGLPGLAIPAGVDGAGCPVGVQLVGRAGAEHALVGVATDLRAHPSFGDTPGAACDGDG